VARIHGGRLLTQWRADGKELYYAFTNGKVMAVDITSRETFRAGTPKVPFTAFRGGGVY